MDHKIYPCIWFDGKAHEAAAFYCSIFKNSVIKTENPVVVIFELDGKKFMGLNGGPMFTPNEAISFVVNCDTQEELDHFWNKLSEGGQESQCGWLKDKYNVSWQIIPGILQTLLSDQTKAARVMQAIMGMKKLDIETLKQA
jgi:predicted 3-demethylubiquinone-9 3-methyltransferase (glyoxalase superfamily)